MDARGVPTTICPSCGHDIFKVLVKFDPSDYEIGVYMLDAECSKCGTLVTAPTPIDHPDFNEKNKY
jgi:hypothetical protein